MARLSMEDASVRIRQLARAGLNAHAFFEVAGETVARAVPIGGAPPFWNTVDPSSQLITSIHFSGECFFDLGGQLEWEYFADDVNKTADVIANRRGVQTLHEVTGANPERSAVFREYLRPHGIDQEVAVALRAKTGEAWGTLRLNRSPGQPEFSADELAFLHSLAPHLAEGVRRALLLGEAVEPDWPDAPGLVVFGDGLSVESVSAEANRWLGELTGDLGGISAAVLSVAAQAGNPDGRAPVRLRADTGRWFELHSTSMATPAGHRAGVIIQPATRARISTVLMAAYGLTRREREITRLVLMGRSTTMIADELVIAPVTVQQHLKSIFAKTGVRSRRDLVCTVFVDHYAARVRDNEKRRVAARRERGGPIAPLPSRQVSTNDEPFCDQR
ncbi:GAF domain-containing protein [Actinokineospora alba]|uniref:GAF domain-containing protein n=1 Tax=Actinokineospora alba TaxID=504798 RepID=A0A1H0RR13_9PSEU|nr:helix-turn-helix transcriptional regulator [Actinokineospora alba]TDP66956.1 GAF domain-containing protein [Actinokineospora alba]SDJ33113.1 GAF domain-containing protein [Actinokineospora alba]SDP31934.1 GAF domain-containing protein [Actinokineospora alba]